MDREISAETLQSLLHEATRAAHVESFHPWTFTIVGHALFVKQSGASFALQGVRSEAVLISLGVLLESLLIAANSLKIRAHYKLGGLEPVGPTPWAIVRFSTFEEAPLKEYDDIASLTNPLVAIIETGRLMERARRVTTLSDHELRE